MYQKSLKKLCLLTVHFCSWGLLIGSWCTHNKKEFPFMIIKLNNSCDLNFPISFSPSTIYEIKSGETKKHDLFDCIAVILIINQKQELSSQRTNCYWNYCRQFKVESDCGDQDFIFIISTLSSHHHFHHTQNPKDVLVWILHQLCHDIHLICM